MADNIDSPHMSEGPEAEPVYHETATAAPLHKEPIKASVGPVEKSLPTIMLPGVVVMAILAGISVWVGRMSAPEPKPASPPAAAASPTSTPPAAPSEPSPIDLLSAEVKGIKSQFDGLVSQVKGVQEKLENLPKPAPPPDLKPIQGKLDGLAESVSALSPLAEKVNKLETQTGGLETAMKGFGDRLAGLSGTVQKLSTARPAEAATADKPKPTPPAANSPSLTEGIDLFKAGKLQEAGEFFKKAEASSPDDARIYYYEAFINAMTTNEWQGGETLRLAAKGAAAEKSGVTKPADIDSAFADLPANLKNWLRFFRSQGK